MLGGVHGFSELSQVRESEVERTNKNKTVEESGSLCRACKGCAVSGVYEAKTEAYRGSSYKGLCRVAA